MHSCGRAGPLTWPWSSLARRPLYKEPVCASGFSGGHGRGPESTNLNRELAAEGFRPAAEPPAPQAVDSMTSAAILKAVRMWMRAQKRSESGKAYRRPRLGPARAGATMTRYRQLSAVGQGPGQHRDEPKHRVPGTGRPCSPTCQWSGGPTRRRGPARATYCPACPAQACKGLTSRR